MSTSAPRSVAKTIVGWLIVAVLAFWLLGIVVGTVKFIVRFLVWIVVLSLLVTAYLKLSSDDSD
jgi:hypothetical protein